MEAETLHTPNSTNDFLPRRVQLAAAVPAFLLWVLLTGIALIWYAGVAISAISGSLAATNDWRFPYLVFMLLLVLVWSGATGRTLWRAYQGRSFLWWHACSYGLGMVLLGLIGIVGD